MKQHYKQNWPHNTRLSIQLAQWPLPMGDSVWLFYFKFGAVLRHGNTHHVVFALLTSSGPIFSHKWQKHFNGHVTEAQSATASATLGAVAVFLLLLLLLLLVKIAGKYSLETKIQMKILLNSIGQTLQEHGASTHSTARQCSWECVGAETYVCVNATWRPFGNGRRNKRPKIALPFLRAICFAEILWKFLGRTGSRATVGQLHGRTDRRAGTGCHVGDIWPNCALMCVCARVCVCQSKLPTANGHKCFIYFYLLHVRWFLIVI